MPKPYNPKELEPKILEFWEKNQIFEKASKKNKGKKKFYFIDGPPYTSGAIHIGHAWNKALKDCILRYKRMCGFDSWSQPGFDMHGLPIEVAVEKKLGIRNKKQIYDFGVQKFIEECEKFSIEQMHPMIKDFSRLGVWMEWDDPYLTIKNEYIEGAWWALAEANKNGYLYEGKKSMTWCPRCATALAKHELTYKDITDKSIFVKLPIIGEERKFLIVWTTTPWTMPFNLAVMAHPEFDYVTARLKTSEEKWVLAKVLADSVISEAYGEQYDIVEEYKGIELEGTKYKTPFLDEMPFQNEASDAHLVVMSTEYVDLSAGSGLVHTAPGCGPEDFEIGKRNNLPPYNTLDDTGRFTEEGPLNGLFAKKDDEKIMGMLSQKGLLAATKNFNHEYAHCWRCDTAVIFRATEQWFLAMEKLRDKMLAENEKIKWVPNWGGERWFSSWLSNIQDWCISRQRFWGIPLPIWKCESCKKTRVVGSAKELGVKIGSLHRPYIDEVKLKCLCGSEMARIPDVLDVWLDSGAASWAPLSFPAEKEKFEELWPADFILEGKDQIRGWFNSMMCLSVVSFQKNSYKAVYMHGFVNDALGRKMSKSLKNSISPYEVIDQYGSDTLRFYSIGGAKPGFDLNYNFEDMKLKHKNLTVIWNVQNFLLEMGEVELETSVKNSVEDKYIISKLQSAIRAATEMFNNYHLNEVPWIVEDLLLELSRTYIQLSRERVNSKDEDKNAVMKTTLEVLLPALKMLAPIAPFVTEQIYQNLKERFQLKEESIHLESWPIVSEKYLDEQLEKEFAVAKNAIQALLFAREKAKQGVRWPLPEAIIVSTELKNLEIIEAIRRQANVKEVKVVNTFEAKTQVKADYEKLEPKFGKHKAARIIAAMALTSPETILRYVERDGQFMLSLDDEKVEITAEYLVVAKIAPHGFEYSTFENGEAFLNIIPTPELEAEGFARELMRRVQNMRKAAGLNKSQKISLHIKADDKLQKILSLGMDIIKERIGAVKIEITTELPRQEFSQKGIEKIRENEIHIFFDVLK